MIETIINQYLSDRQQDKKKTHKSSGKFHVSSAGKCRLARFYQRKGIVEPKDFDERTLRVFEVGNIMHDWVQTILEKSGKLIGKEIWVSDEHRAGKIDAIVEGEKGLILYDLKTVHSRKFSYIHKDDDNHYHFQVFTYADMYEEPIKDLRICYISKDDLRMQEIPVNNLPTQEKNRLDWDILIDCWEKDIEPDPSPLKWECDERWCNYWDVCTKKIIKK